MSSLGSPNPLLFGAAKDYEIDRSLRFNAGDSTYLEKTLGTATNRIIWTWSCWFKRGRSGTSECWFSALAEDTTSWYSRFADNGNDNFEFTEYSGSSYVINLRPTQLLRDLSAWYHVVVAYDSTQGTAANRVKMYVNNVQITSFSTETYPSQNQESGINKNHAHTIGKTTEGSSYYYSGYMTEMNFVDGQALTPSSFGETNADTGAWVAKKYAGTYGNNGFYLNFSDNSGTTATTLGKDSSGNSNNFTCNNFSVSAGVGNDSFEDSPTNNYATLTPLKGYSTTFTAPTNGNLDYSLGGLDNQVYSSTAVGPSGKWYFEITATTAASGRYCLQTPKHTAQWDQAFAVVPQSDVREIKKGSTTVYSSITSISDGDIIGIALDCDNNTAQAYMDGTSLGAAFSLDTVAPDKIYHLMIGRNSSGGGSPAGSVNFGQSAFSHQPSTDFKAWNTATLPEPTIKNGKEYFNIELYTGNDSDGHARTGLGFQPNLVWIKDRGDGNHHRVYDSVRGVNAALLTSDGNAEDQYATYGQFESFDSDGFTVGIGTGSSGQRGEATNSAEPHVAWCWKESATAGFDIVSYTGTGSSRTVSHNLGVAPEMIIIKNRDDDENWIVYHAGQASDAQTDYLILNDGSGIGGDDTWLNDTAPTSSQWEYSGGGNSYNANGDDYIAYVFASVEGYSKFGSYKGNGNADGTFVYCGFSPAYIVTKRVETTPNAYWNVFDTARDPYNSGTTADFKRLLAHSSGAEATNHVNYTPPDILSNGFKLRHGGADKNYSGKRFIFFAFAETPFKYANAR